MLETLTFVIFINDLDKVAMQIDIITKFADETKVGHRMFTEQAKMKLQETLDAPCN